MKSAKSPIKLSDHFTYTTLIRFTMPSITMMILTSIYGVVDGFFVSNFAGAIPFTAVNLIMPFLMLLSALSMMVGTGGTALVSKKLGEGKSEEANGIFSLLTYIAIGLGLLFTLVGELVLVPVVHFLGATAELEPFCMVYGRIFLSGISILMLQMFFEPFLIAAERPKLGLIVTIAAGLTNMILDALLVGVWHLGVTGAAVATVCSECVGGFIPLCFFIFPNQSLLRLCSPCGGLRVIGKVCSNGLSEFLSNVSMSVVNMVYNWQLLRLLGTDGVTAFGIIMYVSFIFVSVFFGYGLGCAPVIGFHYGAENKQELASLFKKSLTLIVSASLVMVILTELLAKPLVMIFVGYDAELLALSTQAFRIYSLSYLLAGINIFASSFFTALNNGIVSAVISFARVFLFQMIAVLVLPLLLGVNGIWAAICVAELGSFAVTIFFFIKEKTRYGYAQ